MGNGSADVQVGVALSQDEAREFLRKLAEDNAFRERLTSAPQETLGGIGITVSETVVPEAVTLPSAEEAKDAFEAAEGDVVATGRGFFAAMGRILGP